MTVLFLLKKEEIKVVKVEELESLIFKYL